MTKLFKNSKSILSLVLAFAVLAVSLFTGVAIHADAADASIIYWDGSTKTEPTTTDADGNILITSAAELAYITSNTVSGNYKIADDIDVIVLQPEATVIAAGGIEALMGLTSYEQTKAYFESGTAFSNWANTGTFQGTFDGNGVEIYGVYNSSSARAGLFYHVNETTTIKNLVVKNSYLKSTEWGFGGTIVGYVTPSDAYKNKVDEAKAAAEAAGESKWPAIDNASTEYVTFEKCVVSGCYVSLGQKNYGGVLLGNVDNYINIVIRNCLVYDNHAVSSAGEEGITGSVSNGHNASRWGGHNAELIDCIIFDTIPYASQSQGQGYKPGDYTDVYTNRVADHNPCGANAGTSDIAAWYTDGKIVMIDKADTKGVDAVSMCPGLDWNNTWFANEGIPVLRSAHNIVQNTENKHLEACEDCGIKGVIATDHNYVDKKCTICEDTLNCGEGIIYWNGTATAPANAAGAAGTKDDPIIITSAEELNYIATQCYGGQNGKWYKIADYIDTIVLQPKGVVDLDALKACADANAVKAYLSGLEGLKNWNNGSTSDKYFNGNFDGNGVEIYGLYSENLTTGGATGLFLGVEPWFPTEGNWTLADGDKTYYYDTNLDEPVVFQNFAIKNSYYVTSRRAGAFIGMTGSPNYGTKYTGSIKISGCEVSNCYMEAAEGSNANYKSEQGLLLGAVNSDHFTVDNCLVYGNVTKDANGNPFTIYANRGTFKAVPQEKNGNVFVFSSEDAIIENITSNSIILGVEPYCSGTNKRGNRNCDPACFANVYTDAPAGEVVFEGWTTINYPETSLKNVSGLTGAELVAACDALDWEGKWLAKAGMPTFRAMHDKEFDTEKDYSGHKITCSCGLVVADGTHNYNEEYKCTDCGFVCDHGNDEYITVTQNKSDCLTAPSNHNKCACGFEEDVSTGNVPGHTFTNVGEIPSANCQTQGTAAYRYCEVCDKKYAADADTLAAFDTALTDEELKLPVADHNHATDKDGVAVYIITEVGHQKVCGTCNKAYGNVESHIGAPVANGAAGHKITCTVAGCGYAAENAPHNFGDDNKCDTCEWTCAAHSWIDDGEPVELGMAATKDACKKVAQKCEICGIAGEDRIIGHTTGEWETPMMDMNKVYACAGDGQHTEVLICTDCFFEVDRKIVTDPKAGHSFVEYEEEDATCSMIGTVAHKQCEVCWNNFAMDAADDEAYENALETIDIPVNPENHKWEEIGSEADCENDGVVAHKYCLDCNAILMGEEQITVEINWDEYYKCDDEGNPVGVGAILDANFGKYENEALADFIAENHADAGIEVPEYPAADATFEEMNTYYNEYDAVFAALAQLDENFYTAWDEYWSPIWSDLQTATRYLYVVGLATESGVDFIIPATGHTIVKVDEVAATYEKDGVKAHYACECGKLYSDAEGKNEVTAESLVIAKLVKEDKPAGDGSTTSPVTGENVASVAAVAALMGAAFVLVRKSKKA